MKKILIDVPLHTDSLERLKSIDGIDVEVIEHVEALRHIDKEIVADKNVLFCDFPPENFDEMNNIEYIQLASSGYNQLFGFELHQTDIKVCNAAGVNDIPIAEWNIAMIVNLARNVRVMMNNQNSGIWDRDAKFQKEINALTLGIWGYGGILVDPQG